MTSITLTDLQSETLTATFKDAHGNPTSSLTAPVWTVDHPEILTISPATDGQTCLVTAAGPVGVATVTCASQDFAGHDISDTCEVTVTASGPESVVIVPGTPA